MSDLALTQVRHPKGGQLLAEVYLTPGGTAYARCFRRGETWDAQDVHRAESGRYVVGPQDAQRPVPTALVCPAHGLVLAWLYIPAGETAICRAWCRRCNTALTLARVAMPDGDVILAPVLDPRRMRTERTLVALLGPWAELVAHDA